MMEISLGSCIAGTKTVRVGKVRASAWEHGCKVAAAA